MIVGFALRGFECGCWLCPAGFDCGLLAFALRGFNCGLLALPYGVLTVIVGFALQGFDTPPVSRGNHSEKPSDKNIPDPPTPKKVSFSHLSPHSKSGEFQWEEEGFWLKEGTYRVARPKTNKLKTGSRVQLSHIRLQHKES